MNSCRYLLFHVLLLHVYLVNQHRKTRCAFLNCMACHSWWASLQKTAFHCLIDYGLFFCQKWNQYILTQWGLVARERLVYGRADRVHQNAAVRLPCAHQILLPVVVAPSLEEFARIRVRSTTSCRPTPGRQLHGKRLSLFVHRRTPRKRILARNQSQRRGQAGLVGLGRRQKTLLRQISQTWFCWVAQQTACSADLRWRPCWADNWPRWRAQWRGREVSHRCHQYCHSAQGRTPEQKVTNRTPSSQLYGRPLIISKHVHIYRYNVSLFSIHLSHHHSSTSILLNLLCLHNSIKYLKTSRIGCN